MAYQPPLMADLEDFVSLHRPHGPLNVDASEPGPNGYRLVVSCPCGVTFERWVTRGCRPRPCAARKMELTPAGRRLRAALAAVLVTPSPPDLQLVHGWLDSWMGLGLIVDGMARQGYDVQLRQYPQGWRVNFTRRGSDRVAGSGWAGEPWRSTQEAAWTALREAA